MSNEPIEVPFSRAMPLVACGSIVRNCNLKQLLIDGSDDFFVLYEENGGGIFRSVNASTIVTAVGRLCKGFLERHSSEVVKGHKLIA